MAASTIRSNTMPANAPAAATACAEARDTAQTVWISAVTRQGPRP
jgi:hypothetical protein